MHSCIPRTVAIAIFALTGCSTFGTGKGGMVAHKPESAPRVLSQTGSTGPATATNGMPWDNLSVRGGGSRSDWQASYVAEQLQQGANFEQRGRVREARACYEKALHKDPYNVTVHHRLAIMCDLEGHYVEAEQHYLAALESDTTNSDVLSDLGYSYLLQKRFRESEQALQEALQHNPNHQYSLAHLGTLFGLQGDYPRAREYLTRAGGELRAQKELASLFPQGPPTGNTIASTEPLASIGIGQNSASTATSNSLASTNPAAYPNEATRKLAEQIERERQKVAQANPAKPTASSSGVSPHAPSSLQPGDRTQATSGSTAAAQAEQRRQHALDHLRHGPTAPGDINRIFSQMDSEGSSRTPSNLSAARDAAAVARAATFNEQRGDGHGTSLSQVAGAATARFDNLPSSTSVTPIPTQPPQGGVSHIPTQISDTAANPFAANGDPSAIEQARAIAAQMGLNAATGSLPPVSAPEPRGPSKSAASFGPSANVTAASPQANNILMQPPASSPTVQQALAASTPHQPPPWNPQAPRSLPQAGNATPSGQPPRNAATATGPAGATQLLPNASGPPNIQFLPNTNGSQNAHLLPNANVGSDPARSPSETMQSPTDLMSQFQQQQQQILKLQQELERIRLQGSTYQMYQYSTGQPAAQVLPR